MAKTKEEYYKQECERLSIENKNLKETLQYYKGYREGANRMMETVTSIIEKCAPNTFVEAIDLGPMQTVEREIKTVDVQAQRNNEIELDVIKEILKDNGFNIKGEK